MGPKTYVGSTTRYKARMRSHFSNRDGTTSHILIDEYGKDNLIFTILETCTVANRYICEQYWLDFVPNTVNICNAVKKHKPLRESKKPKWISGTFKESPVYQGSTLAH